MHRVSTIFPAAPRHMNNRVNSSQGKFFFSLLKLKFLLSFVGFAGIYWALYGAKFGIGLAALIMLHEFGHFIAVKRRGLPADLPVFIPGFGAYVRWTAVGMTPEARAEVGLASFSALINLLNLIPIGSLDGGQAMVAINRAGRIGIAIAAVMFAAFFSQPLLLLVAGGALFRAFDRTLSPDAPPHYGVTAYFVILLCVLGYVCTLAPLGAHTR